MDNSIVLMEESQRKSDHSVESTSKSGSLVQINLIAIDISSSMEMIESPKHEHFSIRGFVAGMRKKDLKTCLPFASEGSDVDLVDNLPPLFVPTYRWWQCSNCYPETKISTEGMAVATRSDAGTDSCQDFGDKNGFLHDRENTGNKLRLRDNTVGEENNQSKTIKRSNLCCTERHKSTTCSRVKTDVRDQEAGNQCVIADTNPFQIIERRNNTTDASDVAERPSCIVDEPENASSESDGTCGALPHRRKPKLRYLADIMVKERHPTIDNPRTRSASSSGMQVVSSEMEAVLGPQPELDVPADVAKAATIPEKKRKIALGENRGPLGVINPTAVAKKIKGPVLDTGKNCTRVEISGSESEEDASLRLDLRLGARTQRIKPKKIKALYISKKMRRVHREDGTAPVREFPQINGACSAKLQKHAVPLETSSGKLGHAPSTIGETGPGFRSSQSGKEIEKISNHSKNKMAEVGADRNPLLHPSKSNLRDCNIRGKVALDLSLDSFKDPQRNLNNQASFRQHTGIPDLNEESPEKIAMTQEQQLTTLSEKRSLPLHKTLDESASCSNETTREGKRQLGVSELKNKEHNVELGGADDIPMEIVELLAENQRERALENSRRHILGMNNSTRGYSALYVDGRPGLIDFPLAKKTSGLTVVDGNMGVRQNIPIKFPQLNNCQLDMSKPEASQFRLFCSPASSQQRKTQFAASSSMMAGPQSSTVTELLWSSTRENSPYHLSIASKDPIEPSNMRVHSFLHGCRKGKTINDMKDRKEKKAAHNAAAIKEGIMGPISTSIGSLDPYSNDKIPAMQLLSLMDQRVVSGSTHEVGTKSFLDKFFSPCNNHPSLDGKENQNFLSGSFFSQNSHSKDFSGLRYGVYCSGESSKKASSKLRVQTPQELRNSKATLLEGSSDLVTLPARSDSALGVCTLNRNPADFSTPDARNEFTLSAKDLKSRKRNASKDKSQMVNVEGRKRQRMRKEASGKERSVK